MGSQEGVIATAAARIGVSVDTYRRRRASGQKWCHKCKAWHPVELFARDASRSDGLSSKCKNSVNTAARAAYSTKPRPSPGRRFIDARDGDKLQARRRVNHLVSSGLLPRPNDLPCTDCGHIGAGPRHEYDHYLGYEAEHHEDVEPACNPCHAKREVERRGRQNLNRVDTR